jgi:hypothetical protein
MWSLRVRASFFVRTAVVLGATLVGIPTPLPTDSGAFGVTSAEARIYTRKRVNGRWITGRFASGSGASESSGRRERSSRRTRVSARASAAAEREATREAAKEAAREAAREVAKEAARQAAREAAAKEASRAAARTEVAPREAPIQPRMQAMREAPPAPVDDRMLKLQEALQSRAKALVTTPIPAGPSPAPVEAKAAIDPPAMPVATGSLNAVSNPRAEPKSVTFDFQSGVKTTLFANGALIQEKFDVPSLRGLAAPVPGAGPVRPAIDASPSITAVPVASSGSASPLRP